MTTFLHLGPDAIRPFLLKEPFELYKDEVIDKDIMVSTSQMVRLNDDTLSQLCFETILSRIIFAGIVSILQCLSSFIPEKTTKNA